MSQDQYQTSNPGADQQALIQYLLQQMTPEWSVSEQAYQPFDIGNETSGLNIMQDRFSLMENPLMAILNGTFDYSLLNDVLDEGDGASEPPDSTYTNLYGSNKKYAPMIEMLQQGNSANDAALEMFLGEQAAKGEDVSEMTQADAELNPIFKSYVDVANQLQPEIAANFSYQPTGGGMRKSDMAQFLESMGITSDQTEDSYFSDSIDQDRIDESRMLEDTAKIIKDFENGWGGSGKVPSSALDKSSVPGYDPPAAVDADSGGGGWPSWTNPLKVLDGWINNQNGSNVSEEDKARIADIESEREANRYGFGAEQTPDSSSYDRAAAELEALGPFNGPRGGVPMGGMPRGETASGGLKSAVEEAYFEATGSRLPYEEIPEQLRGRYEMDILIADGQMPKPGRAPGPEGTEAYRDASGAVRQGVDPQKKKAVEDAYFDQYGRRVDYLDMSESMRVEMERLGRQAGSVPGDSLNEVIARLAEAQTGQGGKGGKGAVEDQYGGSQRPSGSPSTPWTVSPEGGFGPLPKQGDNSIVGNKAREQALLNQVMGDKSAYEQYPSQAVPWRHRQSDGIINNKAREQSFLQQVLDEKSLKEKQQRDAPRIASRKAFESRRSSTEDIMKYVNARAGRIHGNSTAIEDALIRRERDTGRTAQQDAVVRMLLGQPRG